MFLCSYIYEKALLGCGVLTMDPCVLMGASLDKPSSLRNMVVLGPVDCVSEETGKERAQEAVDRGCGESSAWWGPGKPWKPCAWAQPRHRFPMV